MPGGFIESDFSADTGEDTKTESDGDAKYGFGGGLAWRSAFSKIHAYVSHSRRVDTETRWPDLERGI
ncbi:hypothetical protein HGRIS_003390 [Hohenbuehelia grisea]|uniref:Uncharacterized protein n=1 Tax=Hohenbuehelia grisea TaxID=104357 RepID=A0ABR3JFB1_9AGAR